MCIFCCPPICWAAFYAQSAARTVGEPRSPEEIERQRVQREKKGLGAGERWDSPTVDALHQPGSHAARETDEGGAVTPTPSVVEMTERQDEENSAENRV